MDSTELLHHESLQNEAARFAHGAVDADGVILAGTVGHDAHWTRGWPRPALPLSACNMIENLLDRLVGTLAGPLALCVNGRAEWLGEQVRRRHPRRSRIAVHCDAMPRGSAGCLRDCRDRLSGRTILAMGASVWLDDDPRWLLQRHRDDGNALTLFCTRPSSPSTRPALDVLRPTSLFCCEPTVLDFVRTAGFQDVKEQLIPALRRAGLRVGAVALRGGTAEVTDWESYMLVLAADLVRSGAASGANQLADQIYCGEDVEIGKDARLVGPLSLGDRCRIGDRALLIGPTVLGSDCVVEEDARLIRVVAPVAAKFASDSPITDLFVADHVKERFPFQSENPALVGEHAVPVVRGSQALDPADPGSTHDTENLHILAAQHPNLRDGVASTKSVDASAPPISVWLLPGLILSAVFVWAFQGPVERLWNLWQSHPDYGVGQLVPIATAYLAYTRRDVFRGWVPQFWLPGLGVFLSGAALIWMGEWYAYPFLAYAGVVAAANGIWVSLLGRRRWNRFLYPMLFLFLACPLPQRLHETVMLPLQTLGAALSSGLLEVLGVPALRSGHVLEIKGHQVAVAEACSGLRMVMALVVVVAFVADLVRRPGWQRAVIILSAIPVALACNVARIVLAALLYYADLAWLAEGAFHDAAGLAMVPLALGFIVLELRWIDTLTRRVRTPVILGSKTRALV